MINAIEQQQLALLIKLDVPKELAEKFVIFNRLNPKAWEKFQELTISYAERGEKINANFLREFVRQSRYQKTQKYKFNNNYTPVVARLFNHKYRNQYPNYFTTRCMKLQEAPLSDIEQKRAENLQILLNLPSTNTLRRVA